MKDFLKDVPVTFDETKLLDGYPGKYVLLVARKGESWFMAGINSQKEPDDFRVKCHFLKTGNYALRQIKDDNSTTENSFHFDRSVIKNNFELNINLLPYGGFVAEIIPE